MLDFLKKQKEKNESFWALLIEPEWITSSIWQIENGKVEIISTSPATRWESTGDERGADLIEPIDASLSSCTQNLPEDFPDPTKTVFGVPNSWIEGGNIKEEYLEKLKKICEDLSLVPSGFVVLSEAISHFIKQEEETPLSGIVVGISDEALDLSIFDTGKLIGTTSVMRSVSVEEDVVEGISRLATSLENLPSRIILFNQNKEELEEIKNLLNDADWNKINNSKFIHAPKIEVLDPNKKILAVALAGGSEIGEVSGIAKAEGQEAEETEEIVNEESNLSEPEGLTAEDLGFAIGEQKVPEKKINVALPKMPKFNDAVARLSSFKIPSIPKFNFPSISLPQKLNGKPLVIGGTALLTFLIAAFIIWWFVPKASVTVYVSPQKIEENINVNTDNDLKLKKLDVTVNGEKTKPTSGTKTIGEKSKGSAKVQNGTAFPINLPTGTVLVSSADLKFVTTKSASISGALSPSSPGTGTIDIEAGSIGSEYNLAKDEVFKVANFPKSEVDATSVDNLSGGLSKQISAVSEEDRKSLLKDLTDELMEKAKNDLSDKISTDEVLIDSLLESSSDEEDFSNKTGDEASNLKLSLALTITGTVVSKSELAAISKKALEAKIPSGFILRDDQLSYNFSDEVVEDTIDIKVTANLLPNIDPLEISKKITGKYPSLAEAYLGSVPGFIRAEFRLLPLLPGKLGTLPHLSKNITVTISAEK